MQPIFSAPPPFIPVSAHTQNSTWTSALKLTRPANADGLNVQALSQNVRVLFQLPGGSALATASIGFELRAGDPTVFIPLPLGATVVFMQETATATLEYQWVKLAVAF